VLEGRFSGKMSSSRLRLVTFNVCFERPDTFQLRFNQIVNLLERESYDVVALQECVESLQVLLQAKLSKEYAISESPGVDYFSTMLCKRKFKPRFVREEFTSTNMERDLLYTDVHLPEGAVLTCADVHLESLDCQQERIYQMKEVNESLRFKKNVVLMGDFNFGAHRNYRIVPGEALHNLSLKQCLPDYVDVWASRHPTDPGYTFDHSRNQWKFDDELKAKGGFRFDRVMVKLLSKQFSVVDIRLIGHEAIGKKMMHWIKKEAPIHMSDHLAVQTTLEVPVGERVETMSEPAKAVTNVHEHEVITLEDDESGDVVKKLKATSEDVVQGLLGEEPSIQSPHIRVAMVLTNGKRISRRFDPDANATCLFWWAGFNDRNLEERTFAIRFVSSGELIGRSTDADIYDRVLSQIPSIQNSLLRVTIV